MPFLLRSKVPSGRALALCAAAALAGCGDAVPLDTTVGPFAYEVDLARITLPEPWRAGAILPGIACQSAAQCPSLGTSGPTVRCNNNLCDPDPFGFDLALPNAIDLNADVPGLDALGGAVESVTITAVRYAARGAAVSVPVGPVEIYWGPESASGIGSDGVHLLARLPSLRVDTTGSVDGTLAPSAAGAASLSQHLTRTARRFRLFARAAVDLAPRGALPAGRATVSVQLSVRVTSQLVP